MNFYWRFRDWKIYQHITRLEKLCTERL